MRITEGSAVIEVPEAYSGPGRRSPGFYNADQVLNRDLTIDLINEFGVEKVLDGFGGSGVRGIRISLETKAKVVIAEISPSSCEIIKQNIAINNAEADLIHDNFQCVSSHIAFDYIDVDPYGSPVPYLDAAIMNVRKGGYLGITATDQSTLTGSTLNKTRRRYGAYIVNDIYRHEMGIRTLIGYIARRAAAFDRYIEPQLSIWNHHYYRVFVKVGKGVNGADKMIENIGYLNKHTTIDNSFKDVNEGPVWLSNLNNAELLEKIRDPRVSKKIEMIKHDNRLLFVDLTDIARKTSLSLPPLAKVMDEIMKHGYEAHRTSFSPTGIKTDCPYAEVSEILKAYAKR